MEQKHKTYYRKLQQYSKLAKLEVEWDIECAQTYKNILLCIWCKPLYLTLIPFRVELPDLNNMEFMDTLPKDSRLKSPVGLYFLFDKSYLRQKGIKKSDVEFYLPKQK